MTDQSELVTRAPTLRPSWGPSIALAITVLAFTAYTIEAFQFDWTTGRGNIGSGRFPRVIGVAGTLASACALAVALWHRRTELHRPERTHEGAVPESVDPAAGVLAVGSSVALLLLLDVLGGIVAGFLFLLVNLELLNRGRRAMNLAIAAGFVAGTYALMHLLLDSPWPVGLLGF